MLRHIHFLSLIVTFALALTCHGISAVAQKPADSKKDTTDKAASSNETKKDKKGENDGLNLDEELLKDAGIGIDDAKLIAWLKEHSESDDDLLHLDRLIGQLGAK